MKSYKVYINDSEVDLYDPYDLDLAITLAVAEANDITTRKKSNTKTLKFPGTGNNKVIFGHPEDVNSIVNIDQQEKPKVIIEADGTEIFRGFIKVQAATSLDDKVVEYVGVCTGTNGDWIERIGKANVNELDYSDQNHTNDITTVDGSEIVTTGREYVYDLIDRGEFSGQLWSNNSKRAVSILDRFPALSFTSIFKRIFDSIGYTISSNFYSSSFFQKLYWIFTNVELKHPDTYNADLVCTAQSNVAKKVIHNVAVSNPYTWLSMYFNKPDTFSPITNPSGAFQFMNDSQYFCLGKGRYTFKATINFNATAFGYPNNTPTGDYLGYVIFTFKKVNRYKDGIAYVAGADATSQQYSRPAVNGVYNFGVKTITKTFDLEFGDEIYLEAQYYFYKVLGNEYFEVTQYTFECLEVQGSLGMGENQYVDWAYNLPDVLQLDFITGVKELFNLHFQADPINRVVYFEPRDDFYNGSTLDWSDKLDNSKEIKTIFTGSNLSKIMQYKYKSDANDKFVNEWEKQNKKTFGGIDVDVNNVFAKNDVEEIENSLFAATWMESCPRIGLADVQIPKMWADVSLPKRSQKFAPRVLYYSGIETLPNSGTWRMNNHGTIAWQTNNPTFGIRTNYPRFYSFDNTQVNSNNLLYNDEYYSSGLFQKYFRNAQNILDEGRQFEMYLKLTDTDISNIDFRKPIYIEKNGNGTYFILNKVDNFKSQDGVSTLCVLTKIIPTKLIAALPYKTGKPMIIYSNTFNVSAVQSGNPSVNGGAVVVGGKVIFKSSSTGELIPAFDDVVVEIDGNIMPVYVVDDDGIYRKVVID